MSGWKLIILFLGAWAAWAVFVAMSGLGFSVGGPIWNFEAVGQLGDSFGSFSALMASLAAMFTLRALLDERAETRRLRRAEEQREIENEKHREELAKREAAREEREQRLAELEVRREELELKRAEMERGRDEAGKLRDAQERDRDRELTFFRMLELRRDILSGIKYSDHYGVAAFNSWMNSLRNVAEKRKTYDHIIKYNHNSLDHYFRFTYHILRFLADNFSFEKGYVYARILRAQLSNGEQLLIGLNSIYGDGRDKMLPLINAYGLLHTISEPEKVMLHSLGGGELAEAFESPSSRAETEAT